MKCNKIYYEELRTTGQFNNKKIGIELELQEGEKAADAIAKAKIFVQSQLADSSLSPQFIESVVRNISNAQESIFDLTDTMQKTIPLDNEIPF